jgi:hypothetical protein
VLIKNINKYNDHMAVLPILVIGIFMSAQILFGNVFIIQKLIKKIFALE